MIWGLLRDGAELDASARILARIIVTTPEVPRPAPRRPAPVVTTPELPRPAPRRPAPVREFTAQLIRLALCSREPLAGDRNATVVFCSSDAAVITHGSRIPPQSRWPETRTFRGVADRPGGGLGTEGRVLGAAQGDEAVVLRS